MNCLWPAMAGDGTLTLPSKEVHIWCANLEPAPNQLAALQEALTTAEAERARRFRFWRHQRRYIVGRGILRVLLGRYLEMRPNDIEISYSEYNKPFIPANRIQFNISHSKETALLAFCVDAHLGVDLEKVRPIDDAEGIAKRFFSEGEYTRFVYLPAGQRDEAFFSCWTRKEAFIKAVGEGLSFPLSDFDVSFTPGEKVKINSICGSADEADNWTLFSLSPAAGWAAALAVKGRGWRLARHQFQPSKNNRTAPG